jgi:hypoxanthine phosphoribosyltransferase
VIVEDIIDTGLTLHYLIRNLQVRQPASLALAALLIKDDVERPDIEIHYEGFHIPNEFVVGYGLDYEEKLRNIPYIGVMVEDDEDA